MLFNTLLSLNILCVGLYFYVLISQKNKNYYLSILIRLMTLGLFGLVIVDRYETQNHLIVLLLLWVGFESMQQRGKGIGVVERRLQRQPAGARQRVVQR